MIFHSRSFFKIILIVMFLTPLTGMGIDIYVPSLPTLRSDFQVTHSLIKMTIVVYIIGGAIAQLFIGGLSDRIGRKNVLITGLLSFSVFSYMAAYSSNLHWLMFYRFLQGLCVPVATIISRAIVSDVFKEVELKKITAYLVISWSAGPIVAPVIGGYLQTYFGWRSDFYFLGFYSFLLLLSVIKVLPETNAQIMRITFKQLFVQYLNIACNKKFIISSFSLAVLYSSIVIFNIAGPFLIQNDLGYKPNEYGHFGLLMGFAGLFGGMSNRYFITKIDTRHLIIFGIILSLITSIGTYVTALFGFFNIYTVLFPVFIILFAVGLIYPCNMAKCLELVPNFAGSASAIIGMITLFGTSVISTGFTYLTNINLASLALTYLMLSLLSLLLYCLCK